MSDLIHGQSSWQELQAGSAAGLADFYRELLGWEAEADATGYATIRNHDAPNGGIRPVREGEPPHWLLYFAVGSLDDAAERIRASGGRLDVEPADAAVARIALAVDPQGARFALYEGDVDP